jgi:hypothetical protein
MESLSGALDRLVARGYDADFFARDGQLACADCEHPVAPDDAVIDDIVRFEGDSDPAEELVVYAISSGPCGRKGTYTVAFGPEIGADDIAIVGHLRDGRRR